ncbi:hypothetical protein PTKIN_Ptkin08bG0095500 [Pterospermum kingtungense]
MKEAQTTIPPLFRCPISLDLFTDPVTLCTGQTYDRSSIEKWLASGLQPLLLQLLFEKVDPDFSQEHVEFVEQGLCCVLRLLPFGELECLNMLKEKSKLLSFVVWFEHGSVMVKQSLCHLVEAISSSSETRELAAMIGKDHRFLHRIVCLVQQNSETSDAGIKAISALCCSESNREKIVQQGLINGLIIYILNSERKERSLAAIAMARLEQLLGIGRAKEALINNPNGVKAVVKMLFRVSDHKGSESAVNSLMMVCHESLQAREKAIVAGV